MRTWKIMIRPDKDAVLCRYFEENTTAAKCMYNAANFYIRNTMTGIRKSPEERTSHETEVLHYVFTGIQKANHLSFFLQYPYIMSGHIKHLYTIVQLPLYHFLKFPLLVLLILQLLLYL